MRFFSFLRVVCIAAIAAAASPAALTQQPNAEAIVQSVDRAVMTRVDAIEAYTVTEHYAAYRNHDETHPAAEMTVKTTYKKETGKSYEILSESGSAVMRKFVFSAILDNEKQLNKPGTREGSWFVSANYEMKLKSPATERVDGRDCYVLTIAPKRKATFLIDGALWVDAHSGSIVQVQGQSSKSPSMFTGPTKMNRQYVDVDGFSEATHARAVSESGLFGETVVTIDYRDYQIHIKQP